MNGTQLLIGLLGLCVAAVWTPLVARMPTVPRLQVSTLLLALQLHVPHLPFPVAYLWVLAGLPTALARGLKKGMRPALLWLWAIAVVSGVSIAYSPDAHRGLGATAAFILFAIIWTEIETMEGPASTDRALAAVARAVAPVVVVESLTTILFRFSPSIEHTYLTSGFSRIFLGDLGQTVYTTELNNVRFPFKAGGLLFVNGNRASLFLGVAALVFFYVHYRTRKPRWISLIVLSAAGIIASGSKTGLVLVLVVPLVMALYWRMTDGKPHAPLVSVAPLATLCVALVAYSLAAVASAAEVDTITGRSHSAASAVLGRLNIWRLAGEFSRGHLLAGLGFGGWQDHYAQVTGNANGLPPHNILLAAWADSGLLGIICVLGFVVAVYAGLVSSRHRLAFSTTSSARMLAACALGAFTWVFLHGQGDNTDIYGVANTVCLLAVLIAGADRARPVTTEVEVTTQPRQVPVSRPAERALPPSRAGWGVVP